MKIFAEPLGVSTTAISNVENGHTELSMSLAIKISECYGVSIDWLVKGESNIKTFQEQSVPYGKSNSIEIDKDELIELQRLALKNAKTALGEIERSTEGVKNI